MFKKFKIFLVFFVLISCSKSDLYFDQNEKINISKEQLERLRNYLEGNYFSFSLDTKIISSPPVKFAISKSGDVSAILSCYKADRTDCDEDIEFYMLGLKVEKKLNKKVFVILKENYLVKKNSKKIKITKDNFQDIISKYFVEVDVKKNYFFDKVILKTSGSEYEG